MVRHHVTEVELGVPWYTFAAIKVERPSGWESYVSIKLNNLSVDPAVLKHRHEGCRARSSGVGSRQRGLLSPYLGPAGLEKLKPFSTVAPGRIPP